MDHKNNTLLFHSRQVEVAHFLKTCHNNLAKLAGSLVLELKNA